MLKVFLWKIDESGWECKNPKCNHNLKYHDNIIGKCYALKRGETCLVVNLGESQEIYCRECIDSIYEELKPVLNSKLWAFH